MSLRPGIRKLASHKQQGMAHPLRVYVFYMGNPPLLLFPLSSLFWRMNLHSAATLVTLITSATLARILNSGNVFLWIRAVVFSDRQIATLCYSRLRLTKMYKAPFSFCMRRGKRSIDFIVKPFTSTWDAQSNCSSRCVSPLSSRMLEPPYHKLNKNHLSVGTIVSACRVWVEEVNTWKEQAIIPML